jgi:hypothetical protein
VVVREFHQALGPEFDIGQYASLDAARTVEAQYIQKYSLAKDRHTRYKFKTRTLLQLRAEWAATQLFAPRAGMTVLEFVRMAGQYNQGTVELINKGAYEQGKQSTSQCAKAARHFGLERQGLNLCILPRCDRPC